MADIVAFTLLLAAAGGAWRLKLRREFTRESKRADRARWTASYEPNADVTNVFVERSYMDRRGKTKVIAHDDFTTVSKLDPEWEMKFHQAMSEAQARAITLNSELPVIQ